MALQRDAELPGDRGPIAAILDDHHRMAALLARLDALAPAPPPDAAATTEFLEVALRYTEELWHHIDAENSVLFPESEARLRKQGVLELPSRAMTPEEADAMAIGQSLVTRFPPQADTAIVRGDGCVCCPALVDNCPGLERAWWSESEWDELEDHLAEG